MQKLTFLLTALFLTTNAPAVSFSDLNSAMQSTSHGTKNTKKAIIYCGQNVQDTRQIVAV